MKILFIYIIVFSSITFADLKVKINYSVIANLTYQLDCISNARIHCSYETYSDLWRKDFIKNNEDKEFIKIWGQVKNRYSVEAELEKDVKNNEHFVGISLLKKMRIASFQSAEMKDYFSRLDLIMLPKDREKIENVVLHFYPRFVKWWNKKALSKGNQFTRETDVLLRKKEISKKINQFAHFYEAQFSKEFILHFNLIYRPQSQEAMSGQQIENYSVAEFLPNEKPENRIDVVIHELCHFFYSSVDYEKQIELRKKFQDKQNIEARSAYNLLNEVLASSLGNGLINKLNMKKNIWDNYFIKENSFYNNSHIDRVSKSVLPLLEKWLIEEKTIYNPQFIDQYFAIVQATLENELTSPKLLLNELVLVSDNQFDGRFRELVKKELKTSSMYSVQSSWSDSNILKSYNELPNLASLIILHVDNIEQLKIKSILNKNDFDNLEKEITKNKKGIFSYLRNTNVPIFIIVSSSFDEASFFVSKLADLKNGFSGVLAD